MVKQLLVVMASSSPNAQFPSLKALSWPQIAALSCLIFLKLLVHFCILLVVWIRWFHPSSYPSFIFLILFPYSPLSLEFYEVYKVDGMHPVLFHLKLFKFSPSIPKYCVFHILYTRSLTAPYKCVSRSETLTLLLLYLPRKRSTDAFPIPIYLHG